MEQRFMDKFIVVKKLRQYLVENGFLEVFTPVTRTASSELFQRVKFQNGAYLRDSMEMPLRYMLKYSPKVFEIGQCFRNELPEKCMTNAKEFTLMELQVCNEDIGYLMRVLSTFINTIRSDFVFESLSVSEYIKNNLDIDLFAQNEEVLVSALQKKYHDYKFEYSFQIINKYIQEEIEPLSKGKCLFIRNYPTCTLSISRHNVKSREIINRFELFINGIEVAHGYENENDMEFFRERSMRVNLFNPEEKIIYNEINEGRIPALTSVLGLGVDRLCMVAFDVSDIREFAFGNGIF